MAGRPLAWVLLLLAAAAAGERLAFEWPAGGAYRVLDKHGNLLLGGAPVAIYVHNQWLAEGTADADNGLWSAWLAWGGWRDGCGDGGLGCSAGGRRANSLETSGYNNDDDDDDGEEEEDYDEEGEDEEGEEEQEEPEEKQAQEQGQEEQQRTTTNKKNKKIDG